MNTSQLIKDFQEKCPELTSSMMASRHSWTVDVPNPWHHENCVWAHTCCVLLASVFRKSNFLVQVGAILHDTGKPMAEQRVDDSQKVRFFGHEGISCFMGHKYLSTLGLSEEDMVLVWQMISYHTYLYQRMKLPTFNQDVADKFRGNIKLLEHLISLNAADALGRFANDIEGAGREFWENAENNLAHLIYKTQDSVYPRETKGEAIILVGPPLSGKSTWLKNNAIGYEIVSRDNVIMDMGKGKTYTEAFRSVDQDKVNQEYDLRRKEVVKAKKDVVFDLTHMTEKSRRKSLDGLSKDMKKTCIVFINSYDTLQLRNDRRAKEEGKYIPNHVLQNMMGSFAFPLISEGFDEIKYVFSKD